jgi:virginiamycin B lyase
MMGLRVLPAVLLAAAAAAFPAAAQNPPALPDGNGKEIVQTTCAACHSLARVTNAGYSLETWQNVVHMMVNVGAPLTDDQFAAVTQYLAAHFPEKPLPSAVVMPDKDIAVSFQEWKLPTPGSRPHDPLATKDGYIWYTGHMASKLGRVDPRSGEIKEFTLPIAESGPHGLTPDKDGNIWYTGNFKSYIGKLDPKTGTVTEYKLPDSSIRDPHTPLFDPKGILWFTAQSGNVVGRLDPATGDIKLTPSPTAKSQPYGMVINSRGIPFYCEFGTNKLASIDPDTLKITEYVLPNEKTRPRRIAITSDDRIWYGDYSRGYLGVYDPKTGEAKEWPSPGGPRSLPYGITTIGDIIWYSESGVRPNTLVRFDPKTQIFSTWAIPSGGGVVRNMMPTPDGSHLALAESGENMVALVEIKKKD